jgi:hypothetical protein
MYRIESGKPVGTASGQAPRLAPLGSPIKVAFALLSLVIAGSALADPVDDFQRGSRREGEQLYDKRVAQPEQLRHFQLP